MVDGWGASAENGQRKMEERHIEESDVALFSCPSWARTRTLLIQSQACCQLHQGAACSCHTFYGDDSGPPPYGAEGDRTPDLCSAIAALSQLSYSPAHACGSSERARRTRTDDGKN